MEKPIKLRKKLIEVALPLDAINAASAREKSIRHGHPSTMHLWWARRPLAAARAVIFAQMVDDPSSHPERFPTEEAQEKERQRLFGLIEELVLWENTTNEKVLDRAREEIWKSWQHVCAEHADHPRARELFDRHRLPAFHDPFAGGGTLPLEAQRLGLEAYASDLNPVAVLINKAMIEIPPRFASRSPVNPDWTAKPDGQKALLAWKWAQGLAEDVRYYGQWIRAEAEKRIGHLYPKVTITAKMASERPDLKPLVGRNLTVIAWLWARTVKSPNPAFANVDVPLAATFMLSTKAGKEAYVEPVIESGDYRFTVKIGKPDDVEAAENGTKLGRGNFECLMSKTPISGDYIRGEGKAGRIGARLMAIVAEGQRGRLYLSPVLEHEVVARQARSEWKPDVEFFQQALGFRIGGYGMSKWSDLFTDRQLASLTTFSDLVKDVHERVRRDAIRALLPDGDKPLREGGSGAKAYADAVSVYLAFGVNRTVSSVCSLVKWNNARDQSNVVFARNALPMLWDFADVNPFAGAAGDFSVSCDGVAKGLASSNGIVVQGHASQIDASVQSVSTDKVVSTDPPYYDNIGYADLSDFYYVWLRHSLQSIFPDLFVTVVTPKAEELVATPDRHGGRDQAEAFFLRGMEQAMHRLAEQAHRAFPATIYYAFKQAETEFEVGTASTGWETFLDAIIRAGLSITGTWPIRTERPGRMRDTGSNALASSIVLVCRPQALNPPIATRREFVAALKTELPAALHHLQAGNIAPVDLAQAAIGPGMAVYTRYARVLDAEGKPLSVRAALALINQTLDEALAEQEGDFDADSRWALAWFEQSGFAEGAYGVAETLSKAKNTSVAGMVEAGILTSKGGKVRLLKPNELPSDWDPTTDPRLTAWESVHHLVRALEASGEIAAAQLVAKIGNNAEVSRELAYRLYTVCERKKRAQEALSYNGLVQSWPEITRLAREARAPQQSQPQLFDQE
jgi:putative DNA methylase